MTDIDIVIIINSRNKDREYLYEEFTIWIKTVVLFLKILIQDNYKYMD